MKDCWDEDPDMRPPFDDLSQTIGKMLKHDSSVSPLELATLTKFTCQKHAICHNKHAFCTTLPSFTFLKRNNPF